MTARLGRWLATLDAFEQKLAKNSPVRRYGRLTRATGLVMEANGLTSASGRNLFD